MDLLDHPSSKSNKTDLNALGKVGEYWRLSNRLKAFHLPTCSGEVHWNVKIESQDYHYLDFLMESVP